MSWITVRNALAGLIAASALVIPPAAADDSAAHALAEKFSQAKSKAAAARKAEEEKVRDLERQLRAAADARAAAESRRKADAERQAAEQARADEQEMLDRARREVAERDAALRKANEENERAARARAVVEERLKAERALVESERLAAQEAARLAEEARRAEIIRRQRDEDEQRRLTAERQAEEDRLAEEREAAERHLAEDRKAREIDRDEEARRLAEKYNRLRAQREAGGTRSGLGAEPQDPSMSVEHEYKDRAVTPSPKTRATVLLAITPGNNGIRRFEKTAEPVLCSGLSCFVSTGPATAALKMSRPAALGPANTLGRRALACRHVLGCVFRDVEIGAAGAMLQPVDLRIMRHDRREAKEARPDMTCVVDAGRLFCSEPVRAGSWRAWIVPESVARRAGAELLKAALEAGLPDTRSASWR